jgi:hypothetical protein
VGDQESGAGRADEHIGRRPDDAGQALLPALRAILHRAA